MRIDPKVESYAGNNPTLKRWATFTLSLPGPALAGIQFDDQLLVHDRSNFFPARYPHHFALELIFIDN